MEIVRRLGFIESHMHYMHSRLSGTTQPTAILSLRGELDKADCVRAVAKTRARHQGMRMGISESEGIPSFFMLDDSLPPPIRFVEKLHPDHWKEEGQRECNRVLSGEAGLWRMVFLLSKEFGNEIIITFHHSVFDAASIGIVLGDIIQNLASRDEELPSSLPLSESADSLCKMAVDWETYLRNRAKIQDARPPFQPSPHRESVPIDDRISSCLFLEISGPDYVRIVKSCAERAVSLNSFFSAALLLSLSKIEPEKKAFLLNTAFSLRSLCAPSLASDALGCYISVINTFHSGFGADTPIFELAAAHKVALYQSMVRLVYPPKTFEIGAIQEGVKRLAGTGSFVQDVGIIYTESDIQGKSPDARIESLQIMARRNAGNLAVALHIQRLADKFCLCFNYVAPLQPLEWVQSLSGAFLRTVSMPEDDVAWPPKLSRMA